MSRPPSAPRLLVGLGLLSVSLLAQPFPSANTGVVFSELHHASSGMVALPSYIELVNLDAANAADISGMRLFAQTPQGTFMTPPFPQGSMIPPATLGGVALIAAGPIAVPASTLLLPPAPSFFAPSVLSSSPNTFNRICLVAPGPNATAVDMIEIQSPPSVSCPGAVWRGPSLTNPFGHINRVLYVDSDTFYDFDPGVPMGATPQAPPTPGFLASPAGPSQGIDHVNGFRFGPNAGGSPVSTLANPIPLVTPVGAMVTISSTSTAVASTLSLTAPCTAVDVPHHPRFPLITDPLFDRVIFDPATNSGGVLTVSAGVSAQDPLLGGLILSGLTWNLQVPATQPGLPPGILNIDMGPMAQATSGVRYALSQNVPGSNLAGRPVITRLMTDNLTDAAASVSGDASKVQIDVVPGSTGGGDQWCEVIVYDENGFSYRAKVRNWPNNPTNCTTPTLGLGSNALNNLDIVTLCFPPGAELYLLPTLIPAAPLGSGPFFFIIPDILTFSFLAAPLGLDPAHVISTADGIYYFSITAPGLSGLAMDLVALEFVPGAGFVAPVMSQVATITIQ